ncbi:MAG: cytochrome c [Spirochaetia bacterium]|nr:cytochrome c [Spirochaetia bacterium]
MKRHLERINRTGLALLTSSVLFSLPGCYDKDQYDETKLKLDTKDVSIMKKGEKQFLKHCGSCHSFQGTGGTSGPSLDLLGMRMDGTMIRESIIEPNREIKDGYKGNIMPENFGMILSEEEMDSLVYYLTNS